MQPRRRLKRAPGVAAKGTLRRTRARHPLPVREGRVSERGHTSSQAVAKRRARSLKRETGGGKSAGQGKPIRAAQGQRKAIRGTRLRQRRT